MQSASSGSYDGRAERTSDDNIYCTSSTARVESRGQGDIRRKPKLRETKSESYCCKYMAALPALLHTYYRTTTTETQNIADIKRTIMTEKDIILAARHVSTQ